MLRKWLNGGFSDQMFHSPVCHVSGMTVGQEVFLTTAKEDYFDSLVILCKIMISESIV